jgi:hypothetical protein
VIPKRLALDLGLLPRRLYLGSQTQGRSTKDTVHTKTLIALGMGLLAPVAFLLTWLRPWARSHTLLRQSLQHLLVFLPLSHLQPPHLQPPDVAVPLLFMCKLRIRHVVDVFLPHLLDPHLPPTQIVSFQFRHLQDPLQALQYQCNADMLQPLLLCMKKQSGLTKRTSGLC